MSAIIVHPTTDPSQHDDWKEEIIDTVNLFYERANDACNIDTTTLRCLVYHVENEVILLFPLLHLEDADEINDDDHLSATPAFSVPLAEMTHLASDYLAINREAGGVMLQDLDLKSGLTLHEHHVEIGSMRPTIDSMYKEWLDANATSSKRGSMLELASSMMKKSKDDYESFKLDRISGLISELVIAGKITCKCENIISDVFQAYLADSTVYSGKKWWRFIDGKWEDENDWYVWELISGNFCSQLGKSEDFEILSNVQDYLGEYTHRVKIEADLKRKLVDPSFTHKLDSNEKKMGMLNGVLDVNTMVLEEPVPADYISMTTKVKYVHRYIEDDGLKIIAILEKIFPQPDVLKFFIRSCASMLEGYNKYKLFYVWWGPSGNNGKSLLQGFLLHLFEDYATILPTSLVTGGRPASSGATPDLAMLENKRLFFVCEPNPTDKLQSGVIKGLSGNDLVYFRKLYSDGDRMEVMGKLVIVTNSALESLGRDKAFRSRMVVIPFESTFTDDGAADRFANNTFTRDYDVEEKLWDLRETFMSMIVTEFGDFKCHGPQIPEYVKHMTSRYLSENNSSLKYIEQNIRPRIGSEMHVTEVYASYRQWMDDYCPGRKADNLEMFKTELVNEYEVHDDSVRNADYKH